ncbi:MAG: ZIP family metal transporter [Firmicutes bacterium]|nr:ZIP family metal transporter [Bacillota bacterium]
MGTAFWASLFAGLATGVGALPIVFLKKVSHKLRDILLAFAAGVMVAASAFNLIIPALEEGSIYQVLLGVLFGALILGIFERYTPNIDYERFFGSTDKTVARRAILLIAALALHNIPEGLAVGVGFASDAPGMGIALAIAIGVQNAPEGLVIAASLLESKLSVWKILLLATLTGLVEPIAAMIGLFMVSYVQAIIPFSLAFAAGAMLYVTFREMIPESHGHGYVEEATFSFILGVIFMLFVNHIFGV